MLFRSLSQMIIQAMWVSQSPLLQLPHFNSDIVRNCQKHKIEDLADLMNMEDEDRNQLLEMNLSQLKEIANTCNRYPSIEMSVTVSNSAGEEFKNKIELANEENFEIRVNLSRDYDSNVLTPVPSLYYPNIKEEGWWLIVGESKSNILKTIKRFTFVKDFKMNFNLPAPEKSGNHSYNISLLCDSWVGCDQIGRAHV